MVSPAMGAAMMGTMYFLRANCVQHGGGASGGGLISASLSYRALAENKRHQALQQSLRYQRRFVRVMLNALCLSPRGPW